MIVNRILLGLCLHIKLPIFLFQKKYDVIIFLLEGINRGLVRNSDLEFNMFCNKLNF
jgi:hypothetical protein